MNYSSAFRVNRVLRLRKIELLQIFILTNIVTLVILVLVLRRMLKLRRQKNRSFNLWSYPIPKVKFNFELFL